MKEQGRYRCLDLSIFGSVILGVFAAQSSTMMAYAKDVSSKVDVMRTKSVTKAKRRRPPKASNLNPGSSAIKIEPYAEAFTERAVFPSLHTFAAVKLPAEDGTLSYKGVRLYGGIDIGAGYQSHGSGLTNFYGPGAEYLISKNSNHTRFGLMPNALSYSNIGLKGKEDITDGFSFVFNLQTTFLPTSGRLSDFGDSQIENNGRSVYEQETTWSDSSKAGQIFTNVAYGGVTHKGFGTLTFGRQNSLTLDGVNAYDPMTASSAFSVIGYSGQTAGTGDTEDCRFDNALKYRVSYGPLRASALWQVTTSTGEPGYAYEFGVGFDYQGFSFDGIYSHVADAIAAAPLTAAQNFVSPGTLAGTVSDDTSYMLLASYSFSQMPFKLYFGFEDIVYNNPAVPLPNGAGTIGGYVLSTINNSAYTIPRNVKVYWGGAKYGLTPRLNLMVSYYLTHQGSYHGDGCVSQTFSSCAGNLNAASIVADYKINKYLDVYTGAMYSRVDGGLSSGYINNSTIDPTVGLHMQF